MTCLESFGLKGQLSSGCEAEIVRVCAGPEESAGHAPDFVSLEALIVEGATLKGEIDAKAARLRRINQLLAECAIFRRGEKSAYHRAGGYKVRIRLHEIITWDQEKIAAFRKYVPAEKFFELFKMIYEPTSKKAIDGFIDHGDKELAAGLKWCMSVKPGAPQLKYEKLD